MSYPTPSRRKDVKNEIKCIKMLPPEQQEVQLNALFNKVNYEIYATCARIDNNQHSMGEKRREYRRLLYCAVVFPKNYRRLIFSILDKAFVKVLIPKNPDEVVHIVKIKTAHVSGLPLPERAEVDIWWWGKKLIFQSTATEFSLPVERVMGMGTTSERTAATLDGQNTYFTIEYKKENEIKHIVVRVTYKLEVREIIEYFNQIKGTREMNKQEL